jgi:hypothetical protein
VMSSSDVNLTTSWFEEEVMVKGAVIDPDFSKSNRDFTVDPSYTYRSKLNK